MGWLTHLFGNFATLILSGLNYVIAGLAAAVNAVLSLLPAMPTLPSLPSQFTTVMGWINWFFPVGTVFDILTFLITAWLIWMVARLVLRWAKLVNE